MRPRHAAALLLASWYLMIPPASDCVGKTFMTPCLPTEISTWKVSRVFDERSACKEVNDALVTLASGLYKSVITSKRLGSSVPIPLTMAESIILSDLDAQCVASDDPRLNPRAQK
jgi:3-deoxy-D-arabino-heptulosonate 7-phosphate (DAHP) synthase class II